ncbi:MAG: pyridine nucleotide transhydrogenase [Bacteroidetes bacterium QH_9_67_14]|nr:MAG: pyridine nucleotide transhydrogenase [Bacteroidetes bacterium QH_9_67_14]
MDPPGSLTANLRPSTLTCSPNPQTTVQNVIVFVLSAFLGNEILSKVPQTLHTPLMSGANAVSGITVVGALIAAGMTGTGWATWLGFFALVVAMINVVGGFLVTDRMLQMFARRQKPPAASEKSQEGAKTPVQ